MVTGLVFDIQKYSIHDGPGIRTTVFLKGCPLHCAWCHNPESQATQPEITIIENRCVRCGVCWDVCPLCDATPDPAQPHLDRIRCIRCGNCVAACVTEARQMVGRRMNVEEVLIEVLKDRIFYDESGGGVTLSGGEPLLQTEFVKSVLTGCQTHAIPTALDTCGFGRQDDLLALAPLTNLVLYDIKMMDDERHQRYTGASNRAILENLQALGRVHNNIWIRVPIVPGFNDDFENLDATVQFAKTVDGVRQVNLLPFHEMGSYKTERLGMINSVDSVRPPSDRQMAELANRFRDLDIPVRIGA